MLYFKYKRYHYDILKGCKYLKRGEACLCGLGLENILDNYVKKEEFVYFNNKFFFFYVILIIEVISKWIRLKQLKKEMKKIMLILL